MIQINRGPLEALLIVDANTEIQLVVELTLPGTSYDGTYDEKQIKKYV